VTEVTVVETGAPIEGAQAAERPQASGSRVPALWGVERALRRWYGAFSVVVVALVVVDQAAHGRTDLREWNWMLVTGFGVWLGALYFGLRLPEKVDQTIVRLADRGVFVGTGRSVPRFLDGVHRRARRASLTGAIVCVAILALAWIWFGWTAVKLGISPDRVGPLFSPLIRTYLPLAIVELAAAVPVGLFAGRAASYGWLGSRLSRDGFGLRLDPDHLDQVAGLGPIGSLYAFQATLVAVPAMFVGAWWFLIPLFPTYVPWRSTYAALFVLTIVGELLVFVLPMRSFHHLMKAERGRLQAEADELSARFVEGWQQVREGSSAGPREAGPEQLAAVAQRYRSIEQMPGWPVDLRIRRRLELGNLLLLVPVLAQLAGVTNEWQALLDKIRGG
jgi:hypothetical protein